MAQDPVNLDLAPLANLDLDLASLDLDLVLVSKALDLARWVLVSSNLVLALAS